MKSRIVALSVLIVLSLTIIACSGKKSKKGFSQLAASDTATTFLFVANKTSKTGLWLYDLKSHKAFPIRSDKNEIVAETATNEKHDHAYFVTVNKFGREGVLPFFVNAKLYTIDLKTLSISRPVKLGNGVQLSAFWDDDTTIKIAINKIQSAMASHVSQQRLLFSVNGKQKHEESQVYDFTRVGFPLLPKERVRLLSPDKSFSIDLNDRNAVFLHGGIENPKLLVGESGERLFGVKWSSDGKSLIFNTRDISPSNRTMKSSSPQTATLYLFSLAENVMLKTVSGGGFKHFDVIGDMVIYDDNFGKNSCIHIYDMKQRKETETVKFAEGCGLQNIPEFPDYGK
jgi:hypothetical protein